MKFASMLMILQFTNVLLPAQSPTPLVDRQVTFGKSGLQTDLSNSRFHLVDFANSEFGESDLSKTKFRSVDFKDVSITSANLEGAVITSCNLSNAQISSCDLSGAKLDGVLVSDLQKAYSASKNKR
jgi:uncharacterized protein YjbI with pentapeptide repeats